MSETQIVTEGSDPIDLLEPTTPHEYRAWLLAKMGPLPESWISKIPAPEIELRDLLEGMLPTDELWRCRSKRYEPGALIGFQGIAVVRDGKPVKYKVAFHH